MILRVSLILLCSFQTLMAAEVELSPKIQEWADITLSRFGDVWDEEVDMLGNSRSHSTRGTMFYALGLLQRGHENDRERACRAIQTVCKQQFVDPDRNYHGTFGRNEKESPPEDAAVQWKDYDPNWREFIGLSMILAIDLCEDGLDKATHDMMLKALRHACEGAYERNVKWNYTNISLMSAFLLSWGGKQFENPDWKLRGATLAKEIYDNFEKHNTFWEYNSPTYNGVNLWALAAWRVIGPTPEMVAMGKTMEVALWRDIAQSYHAGLGNCCGPYDRSYGMDMQRYFSITGIAIALATESARSIPDLKTSKRSFHDLAYLPLLAFLGVRVPDDAMTQLHNFQGERAYARIIEEGRIERKAYSFFNETSMTGVETNSRVGRCSTQYHPFTVHWKNKEGEINWIRFIGDVPVVITLDDDTVRFNPKRRKTKSVLCFEVYAPGASLSDFTRTTWKLPEYTLKLSCIPCTPAVERKGENFMISYKFIAGQENASLVVKIR